MDTQIRSRLLSYSATALSLLVIPDRVSAEVHDTELGPDTLFGGGSTYLMDINGDFVDDFRFKIFQNTAFSYTVRSIGIEPLLSNGSVKVQNSTFTWSSSILSLYIPSVLSSGFYIDRTPTWKDHTNFIMAKTYTNSQDSVQFGVWRGASNMFVGLRIMDGSDTLYGYARLTVSATSDTLILHQYGWNDTPSKGIKAGAEGAEPADVAQSPLIADSADNGNGKDLWVNFKKPNDENTVSEYRIMVVPRYKVSSFDSVAADTVDSANYTVVDTASYYQYTNYLGPNAKDILGDSIKNNVPYSVFIQSVADGVIAGRNTISVPSNEVTLRTAAEAVDSVQVEDIDNNSNGNDLLVSFPRVANEQFIAVYRIIVVKANKAGNYTITQANAEIDYSPVFPDSNNISTVLPKIAKDSDGEKITNGIAYRVFVLSVADGSLANLNAFSLPSIPITLRSSVGMKQVNAPNTQVNTDGKRIHVIHQEKENAILKIYNSGGSLLDQMPIGSGDHQLQTKLEGLLIYELISISGQRLESGKLFISK